jgi:putative endonuclease
MTKAPHHWKLYIIEASDSSLYTGITTDIERRFEEHAQGQKGAIYHEDGHSRSSASRREAEIKKLSRREKRALIAGQRQPGADHA